MNYLEKAKDVFSAEIEALKTTRDALDEEFERIVKLIINCQGKVIVTGIGKSGHVAAKTAATLASLGTPAFSLHPAEALHGDLGMISESDIVMVISYSGESDEIVAILPNIKMIGAKLVGITGNKDSTLAQVADYVQVLPRFEEACHLRLAPTSSTTTMLCYGDALAVVASMEYGYEDVDFAKYHPAGALGKRTILRVGDLMTKGSENAVIQADAHLKDAIIELSKKGLGIVSVVDSYMRLLGVVTDGDLRRQLEKGVDVYRLFVKDVMTRIPITISGDKMAIEALRLMKEKNVSCLPVVEGNIVTGTIRIQSVIASGIME